MPHAIPLALLLAGLFPSPSNFIPLAARRLEKQNEENEEEEEKEVVLMPLISHPHFELRDGRRRIQEERGAWAEVISGKPMERGIGEWHEQAPKHSGRLRQLFSFVCLKRILATCATFVWFLGMPHD